MIPPAVVMTSVTKRYLQHEALRDLCLSIPMGVCLALLGHNGAGKTTLMKLILGLTHPTSGTIAVCGANPAQAARSFRWQIGFLPENIAFYDAMTGRDTLHFFARLKKESLSKCNSLLERVGLADAAERKIKTYSKGMRQRLGLAQALLGQPRLLLLDEPTTGLDPMLRQEFFRIIRELTTDGTTVILSSHILTELEARTDLVAILRQGQLQAFGSLATLRLQANLPLLLQVSLTNPDVAPIFNDYLVSSPTPNILNIFCPITDKMALLHKISSLGNAVQDVEISPPTLDDLYVHFGNREQP